MAEEVIIRALRSKNLTDWLEPPKGVDAGLAGQSVEFLRGYHAAMADVAAQALQTTVRLQAEHDKAKLTLFGRPSTRHHELLGGGRASKEIGDYAFQRASEAFVMRRSTS